MTSPRVVLCGVSMDVCGRRWEASKQLRIGRLHGLEITTDDTSVSRRHAEVVHTPAGWVLRDLGSRNGTFVNGVRVGPEGQVLRANDLITVGLVPLEAAVVEGEVGGAAAEPRPLSRAGGPGILVPTQAGTRCPTMRAAPEFAPPGEERLWPVRRIMPLLRAGYHLTRMTCLDELLQTILGEVVAVLQARRGAIVLADAVTGALQLRSALTAGKHISPARCYSRTLVEQCYHKDESVLCENIAVEAGLREAESVAHGAMGSVICAVLRSPRRRLGVLHLDRGPYQAQFTPDDFELVEAVACYVAVGIDSAQLLEEQRDLFLRAATALAQTVELRDRYTANHMQRVTSYALLLADELRASPAERHQIQIGAPLHDIGKIAVSDSVLLKPGRLTGDEFEQMKTHVSKGAALLANIPGMAPMLPIVRHHHERWDGRGYPDGLAGESIVRVARIVAVADAFDAMTTDRPYRLALPLDKAFAEVEAHAGSHFDPHCAAALLRLRPRIKAVMASHADLSGPVGESSAVASFC